MGVMHCGFLAWRNRWMHRFTRPFAYVRAALWLRRDLAELLRLCGTASGPGQALASPARRELPGFSAFLMRQHA